MLQNCAKRLHAHHGQLLKARPTGTVGLRVWSRHAAAPPQAISEHVDNQNNTSQTTETDSPLKAQGAASTDMGTRHNALFWPQFNSADVPFDLIKTYVKRDVSAHFDTVIDPQLPAQTGLPMTVYISQKQNHRPASLEVSQFYGKHHNLSNIFTITIPRTTDDTPRIIGDTGAIKLQDIAQAYKFIEVNRNLLLDVWEHGEDEANEMAWNYYEYIVPIV